MTKKTNFNQYVGNSMIYSNFHMLPTVCTSMLNADGQFYVYILCVFLLTMLQLHFFYKSTRIILSLPCQMSFYKHTQNIIW